MLSSKIIRPLLHKIYDNVSVSDEMNCVSLWEYLRVKWKPFSVSANSNFVFVWFVYQLCRSVNTFTPLFGLNSAITGTFYKEPFPNTMRTMSTSPVNRDNDSASKDNEAGVCLSFGIYGELFCEMEPTEPDIQSNFENSSCILLVA